MSADGDRLVQWHTGKHVHPVYREQLHAVPEGWSYVHTHPAFDDHSSPTKKITLHGPLARTREPLEVMAFRTLSALGYVHTSRVKLLDGVSLVHSAERFLRRSPVPYVVDVEHVDLFVLYQQATYDRPWARAALRHMMADERLAFLLPWSDAARSSVIHRTPHSLRPLIEQKLRTVYPAARAMVDRPKGLTTAPLRVLFIGTQFQAKGGVDALSAVSMARREGADVELDVVSYVPDELRAAVTGHRHVRLHQPGGQDLVRRLYDECDVLLFPSHMDTYGVVVGEAMGYGLPVLAPNHLALSELVVHGENGLVFPPENMYWNADTSCSVRHSYPIPGSYLDRLANPSTKYLMGIAESITALAEDRQLLSQLSSGALATTSIGKLSVTERQRRLSEIYAAATA